MVAVALESDSFKFRGPAGGHVQESMQFGLMQSEFGRHTGRECRFVRTLAFALLLGGVLLAGGRLCYSADVLLVLGNQRHPSEEEAIRRLVEFQGLNLRVLDSHSQPPTYMADGRSMTGNTVAVFTAQEGLPFLRQNKHIGALPGPRGGNIPVLVFGVNPQADVRELRLWSGGAVRGCAPGLADFHPTTVEVGRAGTVSGTLSGWNLPAVTTPTCQLRFAPGPRVDAVLIARGDHERRPTLVRTRKGGVEVFFVPRMEVLDSSWVGQPSSLPQAFSSLAPFFLFLRYAAGDYAWRPGAQYANLTIDDPWLVQPYGRLDYGALLREMERHNYHTSIGFVPWNYDRSKSDAVEMFRSNTKRFSIALHGNNHAHREFGNYKDNPVSEQIANIKQALARMEQFRSSTGLAYDRFMVFPHAVAPEATFAALHRYNFYGTANSLNVPLSSLFPIDPLFVLRPYTRNYGRCLSLFRYSVEAKVPKLDIAIHSFLANPILFYGHENMFEKGAGAFNEFADLVNKLQPSTRWAGLGEIARNLYLARRRDDGGFDVQMYSNEADLNNASDRDQMFHVMPAAVESATAESVTVNGKALAFDGAGVVAGFDVYVPAHAVERIRVTQLNDLDLSRETLHGSGLYVWALRMASDLRDLCLSKSRFGKVLAQTYYQTGVNSAEHYFDQNWWVGVLCLGLPIVWLLYRKRRAAKRFAKKA